MSKADCYVVEQLDDTWENCDANSNDLVEVLKTIVEINPELERIVGRSLWSTIITTAAAWEKHWEQANELCRACEPLPSTLKETWKHVVRARAEYDQQVEILTTAPPNAPVTYVQKHISSLTEAILPMTRLPDLKQRLQSCRNRRLKQAFARLAAQCERCQEEPEQKFTTPVPERREETRPLLARGRSGRPSYLQKNPELPGIIKQ